MPHSRYGKPSHVWHSADPVVVQCKCLQHEETDADVALCVCLQHEETDRALRPQIACRVRACPCARFFKMKDASWFTGQPCVQGNLDEVEPLSLDGESSKEGGKNTVVYTVVYVYNRGTNTIRSVYKHCCVFVHTQQ